MAKKVLNLIGSLFIKKDKDGKNTTGALAPVTNLASHVVDAIKVIKTDPKNFNNWIGFLSWVVGIGVLLYLTAKGIIEITPKDWIKILF